MYDMQPSTRQTQLDRTALGAELHELSARDDPALPDRDRRNSAVERTLVPITMTVMGFRTNVGHGTDDGPQTPARG
jgi:hypothetical protein